MLDSLDNRLLFREVNERIRAVNAAFGVPPVTYELLCECERGDCLERLEVPSAVFDEIRTDLQRFVVVAGHEEPGAEVVAEGATYRVVAVATAAAYAS